MCRLWGFWGYVSTKSCVCVAKIVGVAIFVSIIDANTIALIVKAIQYANTIKYGIDVDRVVEAGFVFIIREKQCVLNVVVLTIVSTGV